VLSNGIKKDHELPKNRLKEIKDFFFGLFLRGAITLDPVF
jgi:hypothetical protein